MESAPREAALSDYLLVIGIAITILLCSIPIKQEVEVTKVIESTSSNQYHLEMGFGGPKVTWVTVMCNRTADIRFMYQTGVWVSTQNILLASFRSAAVSYNFRAEHTTNIIEVVSDGPFLARIIYTYLLEAEVNLFTRVLYSFEQ